MIEKTKQTPETHDLASQSIYSALPIVGAFSFSQLVNYPYNFLLFLIPFLVCESVLIVFFWGKKNKKKNYENKNDCIRLTEFGKRMLSLLPPIPPDLLERMKAADKAYCERQGDQS